MGIGRNRYILTFVVWPTALILRIAHWERFCCLRKFVTESIIICHRKYEYALNMMKRVYNFHHQHRIKVV